MTGRGRGVSNAPAWMTQRDRGGGDRMGGNTTNEEPPPPPPPGSDIYGQQQRGGGGGPPYRSYDDHGGRNNNYRRGDYRGGGVGGHWDDRGGGGGGGGGGGHWDRRDRDGGFRGSGGGRRDNYHHSPYHHGGGRRGSGGPPPPPRPNNNMPGAIRFHSYEEEREWVEDRRTKRLARTTKFDILPSAATAANASGTGASGATTTSTDPLAAASAAAAALAATLPSGPQQTRHARRLYVGNLPLAVNEDMVHQEFKRAIEIAWDGPDQLTEDPILSVYINYERKFSFLEFKTMEMATACMQLDGLLLQGQALKIKRPNDYNELMASQSTLPIPELDVSRLGIISSNVSDGPNKIFIGGLHYHLTESQVIELLQAFGKIKAFHLVKGDNETGNLSKGYCFVEYADPSVTTTAIQGLHGMEIGGGKSLTARLAGARDASGAVVASSAVAPQPPTPTDASVPLPPGAPPPNRNIVGGYDIEELVDAAMGQGVMPTAPVYMDALGLPLTRIVNVFSPALPPPPPPAAQASSPTAPASSAALPPLPPGNTVGQPPAVAMAGAVGSIQNNGDQQRILVLHNMVQPEDLATENDVEALKDEVREECAKYGNLQRVEIPRTAAPPLVQGSAVGKVYLQYETAAQASAAQAELQGRQFGDAVVNVTYYPEPDFVKGMLS